MYVACSTLCFGRYSLEDALGRIGELGFNKFDVAVFEHGRHLRPSEVARDVNRAAARLRGNTGLTPIAFTVDLGDSPPEECLGRFHAVCKLARLSATPLITLTAGPTGTAIETEVARLGKFKAVADAEGILLALDTRQGTLTALPETAVELCQQVPGLVLTLDPSHYLVGPAQGQYEAVYPYVRHVHLRDSGASPQLFQVRVGQGEIEYGKILAHLSKCRYERALTVDLHDIPDAPFAMEPEVRKLKYLLESLL